MDAKTGIVQEAKAILLSIKVTTKHLLSKSSTKNNSFSSKNLHRLISSICATKDKLINKVFWLRYTEFMRY